MSIQEARLGMTREIAIEIRLLDQQIIALEQRREEARQRQNRVANRSLAEFAEELRDLSTAIDEGIEIERVSEKLREIQGEMWEQHRREYARFDDGRWPSDPTTTKTHARAVDALPEGDEKGRSPGAAKYQNPDVSDDSGKAAREGRRG